MEDVGRSGSPQNAPADAPARTLMKLVRAHPGMVAWAASLGLVVGLLGWAIAFFLKYAVDRPGDPKFLAWIALGAAVAAILRAGLAVIRRWIQVGLGRKIESDLRADS